MHNTDYKRSEDNQCECVQQCTCGKASAIYMEYANDYFVPTTVKMLPVETLDDDDTLLEEIDAVLFEEYTGDDEEPEDESPFQVLDQIEARKRNLKGTKYAHDAFVLTNCHIVEVDVAFKHMAMKDIPAMVHYASEGNFEIVQMRDHFVRFIAPYEREYYSEDTILDYLHDTFGHERDALLYVTYL